MPENQNVRIQMPRCIICSLSGNLLTSETVVNFEGLPYDKNVLKQRFPGLSEAEFKKLAPPDLDLRQVLERFERALRSEGVVINQKSQDGAPVVPLISQKALDALEKDWWFFLRELGKPQKKGPIPEHIKICVEDRITLEVVKFPVIMENGQTYTGTTGVLSDLPVVNPVDFIAQELAKVKGINWAIWSFLGLFDNDDSGYSLYARLLGWTFNHERGCRQAFATKLINLRLAYRANFRESEEVPPLFDETIDRLLPDLDIEESKWVNYITGSGVLGVSYLFWGDAFIEDFSVWEVTKQVVFAIAAEMSIGWALKTLDKYLQVWKKLSPKFSHDHGSSFWFSDKHKIELPDIPRSDALPEETSDNTRACTTP